MECKVNQIDLQSQLDRFGGSNHKIESLIERLDQWFFSSTGMQLLPWPDAVHWPRGRGLGQGTGATHGQRETSDWANPDRWPRLNEWRHQIFSRKTVEMRKSSSRKQFAKPTFSEQIHYSWHAFRLRSTSPWSLVVHTLPSSGGILQAFRQHTSPI